MVDRLGSFSSSADNLSPLVTKKVTQKIAEAVIEAIGLRRDVHPSERPSFSRLHTLSARHPRGASRRTNFSEHTCKQDRVSLNAH